MVEYKILTKSTQLAGLGNTEEILNELAKEGWRLINSFSSYNLMFFILCRKKQ